MLCVYCVQTVFTHCSECAETLLYKQAIHQDVAVAAFTICVQTPEINAHPVLFSYGERIN